VIDAAVGVFVTNGYRRTQMQDIAQALGLAKGTLYGYAATKEALFAAALRYADGIEPMPDLSALPLPTPGPGELAALVAARLDTELPDLALTRALARKGPPASVEETLDELSAIVVDLYGRLVRHRVAIKLVDRCASELPELAEVWFQTGRGAQMSGMQTYLTDRQRAGLLEVPGNLAIVSRTTIELCVLWAVHCHFEPAGTTNASSDDDAIAATLAAMITRSMNPNGGQ
jgi:AcrR family transcriptional regulator